MYKVEDITGLSTELPDRVEEDDLVAGRQGEDLAVPGHLHAANLVRGGEAPDLGPGGGVPHPHLVIFTPRRHACSVSADS